MGITRLGGQQQASGDDFNQLSHIDNMKYFSKGWSGTPFGNSVKVFGASGLAVIDQNSTSYGMTNLTLFEIADYLKHNGNDFYRIYDIQGKGVIDYLTFGGGTNTDGSATIQFTNGAGTTTTHRTIARITIDEEVYILDTGMETLQKYDRAGYNTPDNRTSVVNMTGKESPNVQRRYNMETGELETHVLVNSKETGSNGWGFLKVGDQTKPNSNFFNFDLSFNSRFSVEVCWIGGAKAGTNAFEGRLESGRALIVGRWQEGAKFI